MLVRLKAKLAEVVDGIDLSHCQEGDIIDVHPRDGEMLIAEGWAQLVPQDETVSCNPKSVDRSVAADSGYTGWRKAPREKRWTEHRFKVVPPDSSESDF